MSAGARALLCVLLPLCAVTSTVTAPSPRTHRTHTQLRLPPAQEGEDSVLLQLWGGRSHEVPPPSSASVHKSLYELHKSLLILKKESIIPILSCLICVRFFMKLYFFICWKNKLSFFPVSLLGAPRTAGPAFPHTFSVVVCCQP